MGIVMASADEDLREVDDFSLDLAFGSDENDFELTCDPALAPPLGGYAYIDGTEYGGPVDAVEHDTATGLATVTGRTWHGVLAGRRLLPDDGEEHLSVSGEAGDVLRSLVERMGLSGVFSVPDDARRVSYEFPRFCDGYEGLRGMLKANGLKLCMPGVRGRSSCRPSPSRASAPSSIPTSWTSRSPSAAGAPTTSCARARARARSASWSISTRTRTATSPVRRACSEWTR